MLDVHRLRVLRAVARAGSLSGAAARLSYTPSAISQHIAALERETGSVLVTRGARGARLTEAGETLVEHATGILARLEEAQNALDDLRELRAGRVRLASFHSAGGSLMPSAVARFYELHPGVRVRLREADPVEAGELVRNAEVDIALTFSYGELPPAGDGLPEVPLLTDPVLVALPAAHPLAGLGQVPLVELAGETWVQSSTPSCAPLLARQAHLAGFEPTIGFHSADYATILGFVAAGVGVALVPTLAAGHAAGSPVVLRPISDHPVARRVSALTAPQAERSPATRAMLEVLREVSATR